MQQSRSICLSEITSATSLNNLKLSHDPKENSIFFELIKACSHSFCNECIHEWTKTPSNKQEHLCPNCRAQYTYLNLKDLPIIALKTKIVYIQTLNNLPESELLSIFAGFILAGHITLVIQMIKDKQCNFSLKKLIDKLIESQSLTAAEQLTDELISSDEKSRSLASISKAYISTNLESAIRVANNIPNQFLKSMSMFEIAKAYISLDKIEDALTFLSKATVIANELSNSDEKSLALLHITYEYIKIKHLAKAKAATNGIINNFVRTNALIKVSRGHIANNNFTEAKKLLIAAEKIADELSYEITDKKLLDSDEKSTALSNIANTYLLAKNFSEAVIVLKKIPNTSLKVEVLFKIAEIYIKEKKITEASETLRVIEELAKEFPDEGINIDSEVPDEKSVILSRIVNMYLSLYNFDEANRVINLIPNNGSKFFTLLNIKTQKILFDHIQSVKKIIESLSE